MRDSKSSGKKPIQEVQELRARKPKLERASSDITERKKAEEKLKQSKEFLANVINALDDPVFVKDEQHRWVVLNDAACKVMGRSREELIGKTDYDLFPEEQADVFWEKDTFVLKNGQTDVNEEEITWHGKLHTISTKKSVFTDSVTGKKFIAGTIRDITERKRAERLLRKERDKAQKYLDVAGVMLVAIDVEGRVGLINKKGCEILGYKEEEIIGKNWFDNFLPEGVRKEVRTVFKKLMAGNLEPVEYFENPILTKDGDERLIAWHNTILRDEKGEIIAFLSSGEDITERKKAEEALQLERDNFINILDSMEDGVYIVDQNHDIQYVNPVLKKDFGPYEGRKCYEYFHDRKEICPWCKNEEVFAGKTFRWEWYSFKNQRTYDLIDTPLRNPDGSISKLEIFRDITEHKKAEETLRESEDKYRSFVERANDGVAIVQDSFLKFANARLADMLGYELKEMTGAEFVAFIAPEDQNKLINRYKKRLAGEEVPPIYETTLLKKNGQRFLVEVNAGLIRYQDKVADLAFVRDITERKKAEEALKESEERYKKLADSITDVFFAMDRDLRYTYWNKASEELAGVSAKDAIGKSIFEIFPDTEDTKRAVAVYREVLRTQQPQTFVNEYRLKGRDLFFEINAYPSKQGLSVFVKDITESERAEEVIRREKLLSDSIVDNTPAGIAFLDNDFVLRKCNNTYTEFIQTYTPYTSEQALGMSHFDYAPGSRPQVEEWFQKVLDTGQVDTRYGFKLVLKHDGQEKISYWDTSVAPVLDAEGKAEGMLILTQDVTERKQAEQKLLDDQAQLKSLASQLTLAEERERRHIASELHDQISQSLVISKMKLEALCKSGYGKELDNALDEVCNSLGQTIADTRSLTFDLSSPILYELGFEAAVAEWLTEQIRKKHGIKTEFEDDGQPKPLDDDIQPLLFRNVRELLVNVVRHANAKNVKVSIRKVDDRICVSVEDDGVGFDVTEVESMVTEKAKFGLFSIRERLEQLRGHLEIESEPGQGSRITMFAPLKDK